MPDISMCANHNCPLKEHCYRYKAQPNSFSQSYDQFTFTINQEGKPECENYREYKTKTNLK